MKWAGHVVGMRDMGRRELYLGNLKDRYHFRELGVDGIIILNYLQETCGDCSLSSCEDSDLLECDVESLRK